MLGEEDPASGGIDGLVRRLFDAFAARDLAALLDIVDPEMEFFGPTATVLNEGRCYRGHEGMRRYFRDAEALWEKLELDPQELRVIGNHVVALGRVRARARDGLEVDTAAAWVWRIEHGRVTWGCAYGDPDEMPRSLQESGRAPSTFEVSRSPVMGETTRTPEPLR
jgi:ketosteroid isomerase-like protein